MIGHYACPICGKRWADESGQALAFSNESVSGGSVAWYRDTREPYESHVCCVVGRVGWAGEAHLRGIVLSVYDGPFEKR